MRKEILLPVLAAAGGGVGCALRIWGLNTAFEPDTGLPIPGMPATWALILFSAAMAVVFLLLCRGKYLPFPGGYDQAFTARGSTLYVGVTVLSGFLLLGAAVLNVLSVLGPQRASFTRLILAVMCFISFFCVLFTAKNNFRGAGRGRYSFALLMPAYTCCVWLITAYQVRAGDPVQLDYIYELFAIIAVLLGIYFTAGFSFTRGRPYPACLFSLLGIYFSIVTLADDHDLAYNLLYGFSILYLMASTATLLRNASLLRQGRLPWQPAPEKEEEETEGTTHEP